MVLTFEFLAAAAQVGGAEVFHAELRQNSEDKTVEERLASLEAQIASQAAMTEMVNLSFIVQSAIAAIGNSSSSSSSRLLVITSAYSFSLSKYAHTPLIHPPTQSLSLSASFCGRAPVRGGHDTYKSRKVSSLDFTYETC